MGTNRVFKISAQRERTQENETNEDGTDLSKPIFDDYFFGDDYDYD